MSTKKSGVFRVLMTGGIAGLVVSCAPVAVDMMGDAMVDRAALARVFRIEIEG